MEWSGPEILEPNLEARRWSSADVGLDSTGYKVKPADCHGSRNLCAPSHQSLKGATWIASLLFSPTAAGESESPRSGTQSQIRQV